MALASLTWIHIFCRLWWFRSLHQVRIVVPLRLLFILYDVFFHLCRYSNPAWMVLAINQTNRLWNMFVFLSCEEKWLGSRLSILTDRFFTLTVELVSSESGARRSVVFQKSLCSVDWPAALVNLVSWQRVWVEHVRSVHWILPCWLVFDVFACLKITTFSYISVISNSNFIEEATVRSTRQPNRRSVPFALRCKLSALSCLVRIVICRKLALSNWCIRIEISAELVLVHRSWDSRF